MLTGILSQQKVGAGPLDLITMLPETAMQIMQSMASAGGEVIKLPMSILGGASTAGQLVRSPKLMLEGAEYILTDGSIASNTRSRALGGVPTNMKMLHRERKAAVGPSDIFSGMADNLSKVFTGMDQTAGDAMTGMAGTMKDAANMAGGIPAAVIKGLNDENMLSK